MYFFRFGNFPNTNSYTLLVFFSMNIFLIYFYYSTYNSVYFKIVMVPNVSFINASKRVSKN